MWPRSHTSGLMIGESCASSCSSEKRATSAERALARLVHRGEHALGVGRGGWSDRTHRHGSLRAHSSAASPARRPASQLVTGAAATFQRREDPRARALRRARESEPGERPRRPPPAGSSSIQRAPSTRSMWPCEKTATGPGAGQELRRPRGRRGRRPRRLLAAGAAVAPQAPAGSRSLDLRAGQALVLAVVPLVQELGLLGALAEAAQLAGFTRAAQRAARARGEAATRTPARERARGVAPVLGQRDVGAAGVAAVERPLGLGVAHQQPPRRSRSRSTARGAAASSTITVRRSRRSRLAGTCVVGSPSIAATASAFDAPVASSRQPRAARSTRG